ncbi:MAG: hypothetical protein KF797_07185 [Flavobacteriales bacterium]|nr:hypothetical protein [Flavobacteriales bacterium]
MQAITAMPFVRSMYRCLALLALLWCANTCAQDLGAIGKDKKPVRLNGSLSLLGGPYFYSGDGPPRNQPWWWSATGSLTLSIYGWQIPVSANVGSQQRSWTQPFNRYGMSPYYKWAKFHLGYRSIRFNPYTMAGVQFLGGGVELEPKGFRFAAFYGRFNKPVAQDTLAAIAPRPAYERTGYGVKIGVGSRRNYFDLMFFRAEDDTTSIPTVTGGGLANAPKQNVALGASSRLMLGKRITWQFDVGASAMNEDLRAPAMTGTDVPTAVRGIFNPRFGAKLLFAGNTSLTYAYRIFSLRGEVKQVDPDYRSLGAYYQAADLRAITVAPSVRLWKNKVRLGGSYGHQQDNLSGRKMATSVRRIGSANLSWNPSRSYGTDLAFSNYGIEQEAGLRVLSDTFRVAQVNRSLTLAQRFIRTNMHRTITVMLTGGIQQLQDLNPYNTYASAESRVFYGNLFFSRLRHADNFSVSAGMNFSHNSTATSSHVLVGPSFGLARTMAKQKVTASINGAWNAALQDGRTAGNTVNAGAALHYRLSPMHRFQFSTNAIYNSTTFVASREFTEVRILAGYVFTFQPKS